MNFFWTNFNEVAELLTVNKSSQAELSEKAVFKITKMKSHKDIPAIISIFLLSLSSIQGQTVQKRSIEANADGNTLLECGELTDVSQMSLCLSKKLDQMQEKSAAASYGYPFRIAPTLPPFLQSDIPKRRVDDKYDETRPQSVTLVRRIQGYHEPEYRNFLDLDSTLSRRVVEYRPIFGDFAVPVLLHPAPPPVVYQEPLINEYYQKPVKPNDRFGKSPKKYRKEYHSFKKPVGYVRGKYTGYEKAHKKGYTKDQIYKYDGGSGIISQNFNRNYDREYYVPANSPIIGDIRRSLMDYTGARDLMEDEPEYLSSPVARRNRIKEMGNDYSPFRRSDVFSKDLQVNESQKTKSVETENAN